MCQEVQSNAACASLEESASILVSYAIWDKEWGRRTGRKANMS